MDSLVGEEVSVEEEVVARGDFTSLASYVFLKISLIITVDDDIENKDIAFGQPYSPLITSWI